MGVTRSRVSEPALQKDLARRRSEEVCAPHDLADPLFEIVHDDRQLVREQPVGTLHDEIADLAHEILFESALEAVAERDRGPVDAHADCPWETPRTYAVAASAGVDALGFVSQS